MASLIKLTVRTPLIKNTDNTVTLLWPAAAVTWMALQMEENTYLTFDTMIPEGPKYLFPLALKQTKSSNPSISYTIL